MLLTITTTRPPATELSHLLQADPDDVRTRRFPFGEAMVFFPQHDRARCTAAILIQPNPSAPSAKPSWLSIVLATMFDQAVRGRSGDDPEGSAQLRPFEVGAPALPGAEGPEGTHRAHRLFSPLGYEVAAGADGSVWLSASTDLASLLVHLCVLLPVLDDGPLPDGREMVEGLLARSDRWLAGHPETALVSQRYRDAPDGPPAAVPAPRRLRPSALRTARRKLRARRPSRGRRL